MLLMHTPMKLLATLVFLWMNAGVAHAANSVEPVLLKYGVTNFTFDDVVLSVVKARRENYNAHSYDFYTFYQVSKNDPTWQVATLELQKDKPEADSFKTVEGADCILADLTLYMIKKKPILIVATRTGGYAEQKPVKMVRLEWQTNKEQIPGFASSSFSMRSEKTTRQGYCSVREAVRTEGAGQFLD